MYVWCVFVGDISVMCVRGMYACCVLGGGVTWCVFGRCTCFVSLEEGVASYDASTCGVCFGGDVRQTNKQQIPESPTVNLTWHMGKRKVHKLLQTCILPSGHPQNQ